jgi:hypothetical protein
MFSSWGAVVFAGWVAVAQRARVVRLAVDAPRIFTR